MSANETAKTTERLKTLTIPATEATEIDRLAQVSREMVANANIAQLQQELAYLKALLRAAGIDPKAFEVESLKDGSVRLTPKEGKGLG